MPRFLGKMLRLGAGVASFGQMLLYLPLALDIAGKECLLALSLLMSLVFFWNATIYLLVRNTRLRPLSTVLSFLLPLVIPALLLLALNLYSSDSTSSRLVNTSRLSTVWSILKAAPGWWEWVLRTSSPIFTILEGISTLLCIQAVSRFSLRRIEQSRAPDVLQLVFLVAAAGVYVVSAYFLWESYDSVPDRISATLIGVAITSIVFLSGISFAVQKGTVVETSLLLAYAVFQIFHLSSRPQMYSAGLLQQVFRAPGKNGNPPLPPLVLQSLDAISSLASHTFGAGVEFVTAASSALPLPVLVGLFYRVAVMYAASRIILALKRQNEGYEDTRKLSEEEPAARVMTVTITYSRNILLAVYTHLLLLSSSQHQTFWRWLNVFLTIGLWALELSIGGADEGRFKSD
ncbi:ICE2-domain-containing protein [Leucosporidium creatinivorum]|uniref:ICE2-domain-containing protein n=1 Tax=Leucosporidium creatinivorum TaxID=106004 RepID=A0A1Y2F2D3_9BASI|nr:ICE2-domain-containing protein [Leucosporidium creatinivorum]